MRLEVIDRELQDRFQLLQFEFVACELWRIQRSLIVVPEQMFVVGRASGHSRSQQMLWQNDSRAHTRPKRAVFAFTDSVESVAWCDNPSIRGRSLQILPEVFEYGGMFWRK